jgi:GNAT superfamily N-acetyltransferase
MESPSYEEAGWHFICEEFIRLKGPCAEVHDVCVAIWRHPSGIALRCTRMGDDGRFGGDCVASWVVDYEGPALGDDGTVFDEGRVFLSTKRIDILAPELRGFGLGSLLMRPIIMWIKEQPSVPVGTIQLSADDASTQEAMLNRNSFYEKLGFKFNYKGDGTYGSSERLLSHSLVTPSYGLSRNWVVLSLANEGNVFLRP